MYQALTYVSCQWQKIEPASKSRKKYTRLSGLVLRQGENMFAKLCELRTNGNKTTAHKWRDMWRKDLCLLHFPFPVSESVPKLELGTLQRLSV